MVLVPTRRMNDGDEIPAIGLGTYTPEYFQSDPRAIDALEAGYRLFDASIIYRNLEELGDALRKGFQKLGLKREDVFVTANVDFVHRRKDNVVINCKESLKLLQFDFVDLLLVQSPMGLQEGADTPYPQDENGKFIFSDVDYLETWAGMEECKKLGLAKSIGLSSFNIQQITRVLENCAIKPAVCQAECHPYFNQEELVEFCKAHDIILEAFSPLGAPHMQSTKEGNVHVLTEPVIEVIAKEYGKTAAQIVLRWAIQRGTVPIPRSNCKTRIFENINIFDFSLTEEEMKKINILHKNIRAYDISAFKEHPYFPA